MITEKQMERIRLLSDETLYPDAIALMNTIGPANSLPAAQINGLLNVSLGNTYVHLLEFIQSQRDRTTWNRGEQRYVPTFYRELFNKLQRLAREQVPAIVSIASQGTFSPEDVEVIKTLLAREFIQHLLAENSYRVFLRNNNTGTTNQEPARYQGRPQGNRDNRDYRGTRENRGGYQR